MWSSTPTKDSFWSTFFLIQQKNIFFFVSSQQRNFFLQSGNKSKPKQALLPDLVKFYGCAYCNLHLKWRMNNVFLFYWTSSTKFSDFGGYIKSVQNRTLFLIPVDCHEKLCCFSHWTHLGRESGPFCPLNNPRHCFKLNFWKKLFLASEVPGLMWTGRKPTVPASSNLTALHFHLQFDVAAAVFAWEVCIRWEKTRSLPYQWK